VSWARVCGVNDLREEAALHVDVGEIPVCVARSEGEFFAIYDECSHAEVPLSEGDVEDCTVECWLHGSKFDLRTGDVINLPATEPVAVYAVQIDGDEVFVDVERGPLNAEALEASETI
jgi:3-phenylpropionate/trans-cinnamate dioxygenase ferredoxin component